MKRQQVICLQQTFRDIDEVGFNVRTMRRRGRNVLVQRVIVNVPGQCGDNITLCASLSQNRLLHHQVNFGPYNTELILTFLAEDATL